MTRKLRKNDKIAVKVNTKYSHKSLSRLFLSSLNRLGHYRSISLWSNLEEEGGVWDVLEQNH